MGIVQEGKVPSFMDNMKPYDINMKLANNVDGACYSDIEPGKRIKGVAAIG